MRQMFTQLVGWVLSFGAATACFAQINARIDDIAQLKGPRVNRVQGLGLVVGLAGTGDGGEYKPTIAPLANYLKNYANPVLDLEELEDTKNVAVVSIQAELPEDGGREQDRLDVYVSAIGNCSSLEGGRLISAPLQHHSLVDRTIVGFAMGPLTLDANSVTNATIRDGLVLEQDLLITFIASGAELPSSFGTNPWVHFDQQYITLVINDDRAGFAVANAVAEAINDDKGESIGDRELARAMDARNVLVRIPDFYIDDPVPFISDVLELEPLLPRLGARIRVSRSEEVIVLSGDVLISPVAVIVGGLTINVVRAPDGTIQQPALEQHNVVAIDPADQGGTPLKRLIDQLNQLKVPFEDQVAAIEQMHKMGAINAAISYED